MARFEGVAHIQGREMRVEVERTMQRTRVTVDGQGVLDEKPFVPPESFALALGNGPATLRFRNVGFSEECALEVRGQSFPLARLDAEGRPEPELTPAQKDEKRLNAWGFGAMGMALFMLLMGWPNRGQYRPSLIGMSPFMFLGGLALVMAPLQTEAFAWRFYALKPTQQKLLMLGGGVFLFLAGSLFARWVLNTFTHVRVRGFFP